MPLWLKRIFWFLNTFFMVPLFRMGLGGWLGTPFGGYMMVLKTIGRKSGRLRYAPGNYALHEGKIYCVSGGRKSSDWYKNLLAHPQVEIILPSGAVYASMQDVSDPQLRLILMRQILINAGFAGFFEGFNPRRIDDESLMRRTEEIPLLCFTPLGLGSGAWDAGGWAWVLPVGLTLLGVWLLWR